MIVASLRLDLAASRTRDRFNRTRAALTCSAERKSWLSIGPGTFKVSKMFRLSASLAHRRPCAGAPHTAPQAVGCRHSPFVNFAVTTGNRYAAGAFVKRVLMELSSGYHVGLCPARPVRANVGRPGARSDPSERALATPDSPSTSARPTSSWNGLTLHPHFTDNNAARNQTPARAFLSIASIARSPRSWT